MPITLHIFLYSVRSLQIATQLFQAYLFTADLLGKNTVRKNTISYIHAVIFFPVNFFVGIFCCIFVTAHSLNIHIFIVRNINISIPFPLRELVLFFREKWLACMVEKGRTDLSMSCKKLLI